MSTAIRSGIAVCARGGGTSYTADYLPISRNTLIIDLGRLDRIVEFNQVDAYVTVESGVTWAALKSALDPLGLRTPFYGPFSGLRATFGGAVSQHAISLGSAAHGLSAQSVLSMLVVLADGTCLHTGSAARLQAGAGMYSVGPFMRHDGPDLTGLFTGDCGAFGVKATITLALVATKAAFRGVSGISHPFGRTFNNRVSVRPQPQACWAGSEVSKGKMHRDDSMAYGYSASIPQGEKRLIEFP